MPMLRKPRTMNGPTSASAAVGRLHGAQGHLLGAAAGGEQADADLDQPHVGLGVGQRRGGVHGELAAAAEGQPIGGGDDRHLGALQGQGGLLEGAHHQLDFGILLLLQGEGQHHQVGAGGELRSLAADHQRHPFALGPGQRLREHRQDVAADGVHLAVEFEGEDPVAEVEQTSRPACSTTTPPLFLMTSRLIPGATGTGR